MKTFWTLLKHEFKTLVLSPLFYIITILFICLMGGVFIWILADLSVHQQAMLPSVIFFKAFWIPVFFLIPLLTMRSFAEMRQLGILESLKALPMRIEVFVLAKFVSVYAFYLFLWSLTLLFPLIAYAVLPEGSVDRGMMTVWPLLGGFSFVALTGVPFIAMGLLTSSLTKSQFIAAILCFCFLFILVIGGRALVESALASIDLKDYFQVFEHLDEFSRGLLDTRPIVLYLSLGVWMLQATMMLVEADE